MFYRSLNSELKELFGEKVYKIALDGGFTCPNRDGTCGNKGCIFCLGGSGDFAEKTHGDIFSQIETAKSRLKEKYKGNKFIAYFQSYTNTYGKIEKLRELFSKAISHPDVCALSIATRPDCLPDDVISLLKELNQIKPVWVELGLQTIHPQTAEYIRRGYDLQIYDESMKKLKDAGLYTVVHMIIGLPGETKEMILSTASYIGKSGANGIKLQLLHVLKGTDLEHDWKNKVFDTLSMAEYIDILEDCIRILPPSIAIHRLTGDGNKKVLLSPLWSADKKTVMNEIKRRFEEDNVIQGEKYEIF